MLQKIFILFVIIHGTIHVAGFLKGYGIGKWTQLTKDISKFQGALWLIAGLSFLFSALLLLFGMNFWPLPGIFAIILSQILIFIFWHDSKFGTLANIIILFVILPATGNYFFNRKIQIETDVLLAQTESNRIETISESDLNTVPPVIQNWLRNSGCVGKGKAAVVYLDQKGEMRTQPEGKWLPFTASQYFNPVEPAFVWSTEVKILPLIFMNGRDKFFNGEGEMLIKLFSLINVVNEGPDEKINKSTAQRYLAEICWFPSAALSPYLIWEQTGPTSARATFKFKNNSVDGLFEFSAKGDLISFMTDRYYGGGADAKMEKWEIKSIAFKEFDGIRIPYKSSVTWKLKEGDFNWLNLEITRLVVNDQK